MNHFNLYTRWTLYDAWLLRLKYRVLTITHGSQGGGGSKS